MVDLCGHAGAQGRGVDHVVAMLADSPCFAGCGGDLATAFWADANNSAFAWLPVGQLLNMLTTTLVLLLGFCGLRMGEARGLRVSDLDMKAGRLTVNRSVTRVEREYVVSAPKTWERRTVPIPGVVLEQLKRICVGLDDDSLVFPGTGRGRYLSEYKRGAANWWSRAITTAGIPSLTMHDLRHTAASIAISSGANVKAVQRMLGHKTAAMTLDTYADLFDSDLDTVAKRVNERITEALGKMSSPMPSQGVNLTVK